MRQVSSSRPSPSFCARDAHERARQARGRALGRGRGCRASRSPRAAPHHGRRQLLPLVALNGRPMSISATPVAEREGDRSGRSDQVRVEGRACGRRCRAPCCACSRSWLAVLGVEGEPGVLREGVAQGLEEARRTARRPSGRRGGRARRFHRAVPDPIPTDGGWEWPRLKRYHPTGASGCPESIDPGPDYTGHMSVLDAMAAAGHEQVVLVSDARTGLRAIIAIHSTALGPAARRRPLLALRLGGGRPPRRAPAERGDDAEGGGGGPRPGRRQGRRDARSRPAAGRGDAAGAGSGDRRARRPLHRRRGRRRDRAGHELDRARDAVGHRRQRRRRRLGRPVADHRGRGPRGRPRACGRCTAIRRRPAGTSPSRAPATWARTSSGCWSTRARK